MDYVIGYLIINVTSCIHSHLIIEMNLLDYFHFIKCSQVGYFITCYSNLKYIKQIKCEQLCDIHVYFSTSDTIRLIS